MKILALRLFSVAVLLGAGSWAVWGDDAKHSHGTSSSTVKPAAKQSLFVVKPQATPSATSSTGTASTGTVKGENVAAKSTTAVAATPVAATTVAPAPARPAAPSTGTTIVADPTVHLSLSTLTPTPEMWFYEQMRQDYNNPTLQMRIRGEKNAAERRARIASRAWYGVSNGRPTANITPFMSYYSPFWASNTVNPNIWTPRSVSPPVVIEARRPATVSGFGVW